VIARFKDSATSRRITERNGVVGEFAEMGGATVLLERTRTLCIGYGLIAGMGMILTAQPVLDEPLLARGSRRMI
jgi:hypothetical protein